MEAVVAAAPMDTRRGLAMGEPCRYGTADLALLNALGPDNPGWATS